MLILKIKKWYEPGFICYDIILMIMEMILGNYIKTGDDRKLYSKVKNDILRTSILFF